MTFDTTTRDADSRPIYRRRNPEHLIRRNLTGSLLRTDMAEKRLLSELQALQKEKWVHIEVCGGPLASLVGF